MLESQITRRRLVQVGGAATAALYLGRLPATAAASGTPSHLARSAYAPLTGAPFTAISDSGAKITLRLNEVGDLERARREPAFAGRDDAFGLVFSGASEPALGSGIHDLHEPSLGDFALFISPVQSSAAGEQRYEVVVDRSVPLATATEVAPAPPAQANAAPASAATPAAAAAAAAATTVPPRGARAATPKTKPKQPGKLVQSAVLARRGGELTVDVRVASGRGLVSVRAELWRDGIEHAHAARRLQGRSAIRLHLRELRATPDGGYELRIIVKARDGKRTRAVRRVTAR